MDAKLLYEQGEQKTIAVVFDKDDEFISRLTEFAKTQDLAGSHFTAIGAFSQVSLGFFDRQKKEYQQIPIREQVEVLSLVGNIALNKGEPKVHAHVVVGKADGTAHGGHILEAHIWPTLEVVVVKEPVHLHRRTDEETGLALIELDVPQRVIAA